MAAIETDTQSAIEAITGITGSISRANDFQSAIAAAVEERTITSNETARNVSEAASGSSQIAESLAVVSQSVGTTRAAAPESRGAVAELDETARRLTGLVDRFRSESPRR